jgi:hypothetical protein
MGFSSAGQIDWRDLPRAPVYFDDLLHTLHEQTAVKVTPVTFFLIEFNPPVQSRAPAAGYAPSGAASVVAASLSSIRKDWRRSRRVGCGRSAWGRGLPPAVEDKGDATSAFAVSKQVGQSFRLPADQLRQFIVVREIPCHRIGELGVDPAGGVAANHKAW